MVTILVVQTNYYTQLLRCSWRGTFFCTWNYWIWNACVPVNFSTNRTHTIRPNSTPQGNSSSVSHDFLGLHDEMGKIFTYPSVPIIHRQMDWNWYDAKMFGQTMENRKSAGNSLQHIFKSLRHFQRSCCRKVCFFLQRTGSFSNNVLLRNTNALAWKYTNRATPLVTLTTSKCTWGRTDTAQPNSWQQHVPQRCNCLWQ